MDALELVAAFGRHVDAASATVFVGAGLSMAAGYPSWTALTEPMRDELGIASLLDLPQLDLPQLAQYAADSDPGGHDRLEDSVRASLTRVGDPAPTTAHTLLGQLPVTEFWTTNYDALLERAMTDAHVFVTDKQLAESVEPGKRRVYKMHGSLVPPSSLVFTRNDYEQYPRTHPRFWALLQAQFLTRSFLFLGFSFTDPNMEVIFRLVRLHAADVHRDHFAVLRRPSATGNADADDKALRLFELRAADLSRVGVGIAVIDDHSEIDGLLRRLVARCRPSQVMVSGSAPGGTPRGGTGSAYPTAALPAEVVEVAHAIGALLAETDVRVLAAGEVGALVGYEMTRRLVTRNSYDPGRFTLVRRVRDHAVDSPNLRLGAITFTGDDPNDLRSSALIQVRALLVLAGGDGTHEEVDRAEADGLGVVPIGRTGGTAQAVWARMHADLGTYLLGGRPIDPTDFDLLMGDDVNAAAAAAVRLVCQALFLA